LSAQLGQLLEGRAIERAGAFAVHILTASGAALGLVALMLAVSEQWAAMFFCLGLAAIVDGVDGPLARHFDVSEVLPRWSGDTLDLVVDFTTYVFVPAYAIAASGYLPSALEIPAGILVVLTGALYFADRNMKTDDNYFVGFPAVWNVVAFYLFVLEPNAWLAILLIVAFAVLTFVPVRFVHPLRVQDRRALTLALLVGWILLALQAVIHNLEPDLWVRVGLFAIALYFIGFGIVPKRP
jgi:phosphatidylcholine synthase